MFRLVLDSGADPCGIVTTSIEGQEPHALMMLLREHGIHAWAQERIDATLDYDERGICGALRFSPYAYDTEEEIDRALEVLSCR